MAPLPELPPLHQPATLMSSKHSLRNACDVLMRPLAKRLHEAHMRRLGIARTMKLAHAYNRRKFGRHDDLRREAYRARFTELIEENGRPSTSPIEMRDGWAIDRSMSLPHLDRVLADAERIIEERSGARTSGKGAYRSYFQDVWKPEDCDRYPAFVDFATSSEVLSVVARYLECVPALSTTLPSGIRFVESNSAFDDQPDKPHDSQLYHVDYYSLPNVYVLVLLRDCTRENGPWCFLPKSVTQRVGGALRNWERGVGYRFTDEQVYSVADPRDMIEFTGPRGTVLFIESSGCMHYGSRNSAKPRFQLMYGYSGACRTDFSEVFMPPKTYPLRDGDSRLRRMVLDKDYEGR